ncbi:M20 metallopeptidase family protein [Allorhodopirellula heiligendammensis]|uniref:Hydrolase YxeP n=1 Tax=Allorhodopirellula heiligendammensis TaxID=2714739 RepID=A0A5C6BFD6_9BACT|nr:amidohydrolase [Allorhodopirellula heiligendammensis]TWU10748.1 putative hydrolase YxeP [Allorhodopirellula heiligendammensis]
MHHQIRIPSQARRASVSTLIPFALILFAALFCESVLGTAEDSTPHVGGSDLTASTTSVSDWLDQRITQAMHLYTWLHAHPEVSFEEQETAAKLAGLWREAGFEVTENVGGYGIVGVLKNGEGPTVMLRTDLDALPVTEQTPVSYASTQTVTREDGSSTGVMHACGHDIHMTNLTTVLQWLAEHRKSWAGTIVAIGQPAEEHGAGAKAMLEDGLFERFPRPDFALAMHVTSDKATGKITLRPGFSQANVDSVDITMKGRGGHGSAPHTTIDPIVQAAELVLSLQMIVSREIAPIEPAVITVGSIHGGTKHNVIGNDCTLQLTVRSYSPDIRQQLLEAIRRRALGIAATHAAPEPDVVLSEGTPSLKNDLELAARMQLVFGKQLGAENVIQDQPSMGGEDFSRYGIAGVPILMYGVGSVSQARLDRFAKLGIPPASLHSAVYYPDAEETLRVSVPAMILAVVELMPSNATDSPN